MLADGGTEYERCLTAAAPQVVVLYEDNYNFLSKMCLAAVRAAACTMVARARARGARVIVAGSDVTDAPEPYLRAGADVALLGEGLPALASLIARLDSAPSAAVGQLVADLGGVAFLAEGGRAERISAPRGITLPEQPEQPAWDLIDVERYRRRWRRAHGYFSLNMAASRGCPFRCSWCAKPIWGNQYAQRAPGRRRRRAALPQAHLRSGPHLVCRRHLRFPPRLGARASRARCVPSASRCRSPSRRAPTS